MLLSPWKTVWVGLLAGALAWAAGPASAQTTLRYKFKEGEKLNYQFEQKMAMKMDVAGQPTNVEMNQTFDFVWHITSVDKDGNARMTQKIENLRLVMDMP